MSTVYERARNNEYKPATDYPSKPAQPAILRKKVSELSNDEITAVPAIREAYNADIEAYERAKYAYNNEQGRLHAKFKADLEEEHGLVGHPKADKLFSKAWEDGHYAGYAEVALKYDDLVDLVK
jgi:hypothetical protein